MLHGHDHVLTIQPVLMGELSFTVPVDVPVTAHSLWSLSMMLPTISNGEEQTHGRANTVGIISNSKAGRGVIVRRREERGADQG